MYVDKTLSGIKAVQTLSRLNRARPKKHDVFVLDFLNDADTIRDAFADFYRATILADETDPNKLHDLQADLDATQVYSPEQVDDLVNRYLDGADRDELDPIPRCLRGGLRAELSEDAQADFKSKAKAFVRTYGFLSCALPYTNAASEKRSIFLNFLISKLPGPREEDLSKGILDAIDMDSYRVEKRVVQKSCCPTRWTKSTPCRPVRLQRHQRRHQIARRKMQRGLDSRRSQRVGRPTAGRTVARRVGRSTPGRRPVSLRRPAPHPAGAGCPAVPPRTGCRRPAPRPASPASTTAARR